MKGTLQKTEKGLFVTYNHYQDSIVEILPLYNIIALHPDDCKKFNTDGDSQSCKVEFEIVEIKQICNGYKNQPENVIGFVIDYERVKYAKLL